MKKVSKIDKEIDKPPEISVPEGIYDSSVLPFREWSDQEIRIEDWKGDGTSPQKSRPSTPVSKGGGDATPTETNIKEVYHYEDEQKVHLPYSIVAYEWKTVSEVFPNSRLEVYVDTNEYPNLIAGSKHLLHSEFMRSFIASVHMLIYLGNVTQFPIEYVSTNFAPTTSGKPWRPWHHIYSNSYAGTKHAHEPTFNKIGKYIVRLFWMGAWRKIYVDDKLPVDMLNHVMLPSIGKQVEPPKESEELKGPTNSRVRVSLPKLMESKPQEEDVVELWPFLLSKALLKVASLTWYEYKEMVHFDIVQCLTGWQPLRIGTQGLSPSDIWNMCWKYSTHYKWLTDDLPTFTDSENIPDKTKPKKGKKEAKLTEVQDEDVSLCLMVARCADLRNYSDANDPFNIFPCWDHEFLIDQTRNIPLLKSNITADLKLWKKLRWLSWAAEKGMIPDEELLPEIRSYRLVTPFRHVSEHVVYKQPSKIDITEDESTPIPVPAEKGGKKGKEKGDEKSSKASKKSGDSKSGKEKKKTEDASPSIPDPSFWVDYEKISSTINTLIVYYKPSTLKTKIEISDVNQKEQIEKKGEIEWQVLVHSLTFKKSRNEPIYIFTESIDSKLIILNLSQTGYSEILNSQKETEPSSMVSDRYTECDFCLASLVKRVKRNITSEIPKEYITATQLQPKQITYTRPISYFIVEDYNWKTDALGNTIGYVKTYGSKTTTLNFGPGRKILKLWIKSNTPYTLQIFSDTPIVIGNLETLLVSMSQESQLLEDMCIQIANGFGKVVEAFTKPEFSERLKEFYKTYKPQNQLTKAECAVLHDTFYDLLCELVEYSVEPKELHALRVLLLKWQLPTRTYYYPEECDVCNCYDDDDLIYLKATERYVTRIQAFFKGILERSYMKRHSMSHREHKSINESLTNIYASLFSLQNRFDTCPNLVRALLVHPDLKGIKDKYDIVKDLDNVLTIKEVNSTVKVGESELTIICRQLFYVKSDTPIPIKINMFCDLDGYVVRVFDNDTTEEKKIYSNNIGVTEYKANTRGYVVLCYIWSALPQFVTYRLKFATTKEVECDKIVLSMINIETDSTIGLYIPNVNNIICKHLIHVRSQHALLSIHFGVSLPSVEILLRLYNNKGKVVKEVIGKGQIILPVVYITNDNKVCLPHDLSAFKTTGGDGKGRRGTLKMRQAQKSSHSIGEKKFSMRESQASLISSTMPLPPPPTTPERTSSRRKPAAPHVHPFYQPLEEQESKRNMRVDKAVVYRIEIFVLNDSWPLSVEEWKNVIQSKCNDAMRRSVSQSSIISKTSMASLKKRKPRSTVRVASANKPLQPYWNLEVISHQDEIAEVHKDFKRASQITAIKNSWWIHDVGRPNTANEIRKEFLDEHEIVNPIPEDETNIRSLVPLEPRILPPFDLSKYTIKNPDEVENKIFKNKAALEMDADRELAKLEEAENRYQQYLEKINEFEDQQLENYNIVTDWYNEIRYESHQMMDYAMGLRTEYVNKTLEAQRAEKEKLEEQGKSKKGKPDKKAKKDKKG